MAANWNDFTKKYKTGDARRKALAKMSNSEIDSIARSCPNKAGKAAISAYKKK